MFNRLLRPAEDAFVRLKAGLFALAICAVLASAVLCFAVRDDSEALRALSGVWVCDGPPFSFVRELEDARWREVHRQTETPAPISELVARTKAEYQVAFGEPARNLVPGFFRRGDPGGLGEFGICAKTVFGRRGEFNVGQPDGERCWTSEDTISFTGESLHVRAFYPLAVTGPSKGWQTTECRRGLAR